MREVAFGGVPRLRIGAREARSGDTLNAISAGQILWSAFAAEDGSGCYSSPRRVKVQRIDGDIAYVQELYRNGWSHWISIRQVSNLFETEKEAWEFLASQFPAEGLGQHFQSAAERCEES